MQRLQQLYRGAIGSALSSGKLYPTEVACNLERAWLGSSGRVTRCLSTAVAARKPKGEGLLGTILFIPAIVSAGLAAWQYERMQWKEDLLEKKGRLLNGEPKDALGSEQLEDFQLVYADGHFLHMKSSYVGPRTKSVEGRPMQGYVCITPFYNKERKKAVLVNRGWVPAEWVNNPEMRSQHSPQGRVRVTGVLQPSETPNRFVPTNDPNMGTYFWLDAQTMAESIGLPSDTPLLQVVAGESQAELQTQLTSSNPFTAMKKYALSGVPTAIQYPLPKTRSDVLNFAVMPLDHRNYALVWGSLSVSVAYLAVKFLRQGK